MMPIFSLGKTSEKKQVYPVISLGHKGSNIAG